MPETLSRSRVKKDLVRAWFDTVLNPLIRALRTEADLLRQRDFTWRTSDNRFASLVPVREHLMFDVLDNLNQFLSFYRQIARLMDNHDRKLGVLRERVNTCVTLLRGLSAFQELISRAIASESAPADPSLADHQERVLAAHCVENLVNSLHRLPAYYGTARLWNAHSDEFFKLLDRDDARPVWDGVGAARVEFSKAVEGLMDAVTAARSQLSLDKGVPIVTSLAS